MLLCSNEWTIEVEFTVIKVHQQCKAKGFKGLGVGDKIRVTYIKVPSRLGGSEFYSKCLVHDLKANEKFIRGMKAVDNYLACFETTSYVVAEKCNF